MFGEIVSSMREFSISIEGDGTHPVEGKADGIIGGACIEGGGEGGRGHEGKRVARASPPLLEWNWLVFERTDGENTPRETAGVLPPRRARERKPNRDSAGSNNVLQFVLRY